MRTCADLAASRRVHQAPPRISQRGVQIVAVVGDEFLIERHATVERKLTQHVQTERIDRVDRRRVQRLHCQIQRGGRARDIARRQVGRQRLVERVIAGQTGLQPVAHPHQP